jgi:hypothetical protein
VFARHGYITAKVINDAPDLPTSKTYRIHFGSLLTAYARAGLDTPLTRGEFVRAGAARAGRGVNGRASRKRPPAKAAVLRNAVGARFSIDELIAILRQLLSRHGYLDEKIIQSDPTIPTATYFRKRFGTLLSAYRAAGYVGTQTEVLRLAAERRASRE